MEGWWEDGGLMDDSGSWCEHRWSEGGGWMEDGVSADEYRTES